MYNILFAIRPHDLLGFVVEGRQGGRSRVPIRRRESILELVSLPNLRSRSVVPEGRHVPVRPMVVRATVGERIVGPSPAAKTTSEPFVAPALGLTVNRVQRQTEY